jgi:hypothetical protein
LYLPATIMWLLLAFVVLITLAYAAYSRKNKTISSTKKMINMGGKQ